MTHRSGSNDHTPPPRAAGSVASPPLEPVVVSSIALLAGRREVIIQHGTERYRLLLTASNKLLLVK